MSKWSRQLSQLFICDWWWRQIGVPLNSRQTSNRTEKNFVVWILHYYPPVWFMCIHVHIFWKNYYVIIYGYMYYMNLTTGAVGWGSSICLLMSCTFNTQICSIKFLVLYWKQVIQTWSFRSLKIWHLANTQNMYIHYMTCTPLWCIITDISFIEFLTWIMYTNIW